MENIQRVEQNVLKGKGSYDISNIEDEPIVKVKKKQVQIMEGSSSEDIMDKSSSQSKFDSETDFIFNGISRERIVELPEMSEDYGHFPFGFIYYTSEPRFEILVNMIEKPMIIDLKPQSVDMSKFGIEDSIISPE